MKNNAIAQCPECGATMPAVARTCFVCGFEQSPPAKAEEEADEERGRLQEQTITCSGPLKLIINISQD